ncbi:putative aldouronate transport system substrate-binding protein [Kribbella aluminosa]|uniref:Aldouronate transport system substrate-binding protein n=1 Tax=Kribbella aluminosa TaxID=416017 RepID=A0ABS4UTP7_9ACTN|nr:hypothetical protein [Kribbella aluminosa]MBP2355007.1 putative aldouronate transport system substrate-binding protein [Kribbella aluminosa]
MSYHESRLSRRTLLGGSAGALLALGLDGCASGQQPNGNGSSGARYTPPIYVPFNDVKPDLPGTIDGVAPGFLGFPAPPIKRPGFPLPSTAPATALLQGTAPNVAPDANLAYRLARTQSGNSLDAVVVTATYYLDKFQVTMAGNDLPDFVQMALVPKYPQLLEKYFTDLSDVLGGDGVKEYPALANIPPATWKIPEVKGRLWGIAQPRPPAGSILSTRGDLLRARGIDPNPKINSGPELVALFAELTDRKRNQFAMGQDPTSWLLPLVLQMMGAPNGWHKVDGRFVNQLESAQMKDALNECAKIIAAGYLHPESFSPQTAEWLRAGTISLYHQSFTGWGLWARQEPKWNLGHVDLPKWGGGGRASIFKSVAGYPAFIAIKKQSSDQRLRELLRIADFLASPFGTQEFLDVNYGAPGVTYDMVKGNPEFRDGQSANILAGWSYCGGNAQAALYTPGQDDVTKAQHAYLTAKMPSGVDDASLGLYSETDVAKSASYAKRITDAQRSILTGAAPVSTWDDLVRSWKTAIGDKIADELGRAAG